ncbi:MAG: glycoside hydrolase family 95 protein, partial [Planctomycetales bacterium]|nr:glycoside hydrolase family 95 protein [Planctomycetales bacterium]
MNSRKVLRSVAVGAWLISVLAGVTGCVQDSSNNTPQSLLEVDYRALVSQSDLIYQSPARRPFEGQPIGNGRMGTLVWTTPNAVHFQINRNDVFAVHKEAAGEQHGPTDYFGGCAQITVEVGGRPFAAGKAFSQRLSLYEAEAAIAGEAVAMRCFVSATADVLALEIDDRRAEPQPVRLTVSMWQAPEVVNGSHVARYEFVES